MPPFAAIDWKNPDYTDIFNERMERLRWLREKPEERFADVASFYRLNPPYFINDWGVTFDPRSAGDPSKPPFVPFILFEKQWEWLSWVDWHWKHKESGVSDKSRDVGFSWMAQGFGAAVCIFHKGAVIGYGSRVEDLVDKAGDPDCLFYKGRMFIRYLPEEFRPGWSEKKHAPHMRITFPHTGSVMKGQSGGEIGRGGRSTIYFVDESAHLMHPQAVDFAISQNTQVRIDMSSANGYGNPFAEKRHSWAPKNVFTMHWRDDPRKDEEWYAKESKRLGPLVTAQEIDINYAASVSGVLIPGEWIQSAVDAHVKLGFHPTGRKHAALDVADEGLDLNAFASRHGVVMEHIEEWTGQGSNIFATTERAFGLCDRFGYRSFNFDADGLGSGVRGDANVINGRRALDKRLKVDPFRGSGEILHPLKQDIEGFKNEDMFGNRKAQAWWSLRTRFERTHKMVLAFSTKDAVAINREKAAYGFDELISIPSVLPMRGKLLQELSQPVFYTNGAGKLIIDKAPQGTAAAAKRAMKSPNLADAVMMCFAEGRAPMFISDEVLARSLVPAR